MFIGRKEELKQLESIFQTEHSNLIVLYGREGVGKTELVNKFCENKKSHSYLKVSEAIDKIQNVYLEKYFNDIILQHNTSPEKKHVLVIDEFQLISGNYLSDEIIKLYSNDNPYGKVMIILISSSISWVENDMVKNMRSVAKFITGLVKLKEISFAEIVEWFPKLSIEDCITLKAVFGGIPKYLSLWQDNRRIRENIVSLFFNKDSILANETEHLLKSELRELSAYNTILMALAYGKYKLNDIYNFTGFTRAKISVYLKNLIQMDIVEKIHSYNVRRSDNTLKGLYRIKDNYINFYYAYVFPNLSAIEQGNGKQVYDEYVSTSNESYMRLYFAEVCKEFLTLMSKYNKLKYQYENFRSWYGKIGTIDIVGSDAHRNVLVGLCSYDEESMGIKYLDELEQLKESSGLKPDEIFFFARAGFTDELLVACKEKNITTICMKDL